MPNKKLPCEVVYLFVFVCLLPFCEKEMNLRGSRTLIKVITQLKEKSSKSSRCGSVISH